MFARIVVRLYDTIKQQPSIVEVLQVLRTTHILRIPMNRRREGSSGTVCLNKIIEYMLLWQ